MEEHFPKFPKTGNVAKYTQIFESFRGSFVSIQLCSRKARIFGWIVLISEIQLFPEFLETFRENSVPFAVVSKFSKVLVDAKAQSHALKQEHQGFLPFTKTTWPEVLLFRLKSCARRCRSSMATAITFSRKNDAGSHTRTSLHYLLLRKSRTRGRLRLRI